MNPKKVKMKKIIPSIIAKNQKEFDECFEKIKSLSPVFHLDVMDGKFVRNKSLLFDLTLPRAKYHIHLMVHNPEKYIEIIHSKAETIIFHLESVIKKEGVERVIKLIKKKKKKVWIALSPKTRSREVEPFLDSIDGVLIMTVAPGKYGERFLSRSLIKVKEIRSLNEEIDICVDGGINDKTIKKAVKVGANLFVVGSYLQDAEDVKKTVKELGGKL